jgi:hypothetical protein
MASAQPQKTKWEAEAHLHLDALEAFGSPKESLL